MSFRNRPVLDRKHRPRWQDELRTQQLIVAGFALAIAVAVGIFAAAAWSGFYQSNLRQAALVDGTPIQRAAIVKRIQMVAAELQATAVDLQGHAGGMRDQIIQQQLQTIQTTLGNVQGVGSDSLLTGLMLERRAAALGVGPTDDEVQAEIDRRRLNAARLQLSLIMAIPEKDKDAKPGAEPTDKQWADAKAEIDSIKDELDAGGDFATLAEQRSDDPSKGLKGLLGWVERTDGQYGDYFKAAAKAEAGDVVGPIKTDTGWYLLKVDDRQAAGRDERCWTTSSRQRASPTRSTTTTFARRCCAATSSSTSSDRVVTRYQPQREVAQIFLNPDQGQPVPKLRVRHLLVQPIPGAEDQSTATAAQWRAARREAEKLHQEAVKQKDGQWWELAKQSDDQGSATRGGYLGWYDPATMAQQFVPEFAKAANDLRIGEISPLVRTEFGYHVIQVTERRTNALEQADQLVTQAAGGSRLVRRRGGGRERGRQQRPGRRRPGLDHPLPVRGRQGRGDLRHDRARRDLGPGGDGRRHLHLQAARTRPTSGSCRSTSATRWGPAASTAGWTRCAIRPASGSIRSSPPRAPAAPDNLSVAARQLDALLAAAGIDPADGVQVASADRLAGVPFDPSLPLIVLAAPDQAADAGIHRPARPARAPHAAGAAARPVPARARFCARCPTASRAAWMP